MSADMRALPRSSLNDFLFADIGTEANGMALSVLSVLARFDLDPWQEASRLAGLSRAKSVEAMASMIKSMPASRWSLSEAVPIATRLVALLPRHADGSGAAHPLRTGGADPLRRNANDNRRIQIRTGAALTGRQWAGVVALLAALFAGLATGVVLRPADEPAGSDATAQALPDVVDGSSSAGKASH